MKYLILSLLFLATPAVAAASFSLHVAPTERGGVVTVYIEGTESPINAVEGTVVLPEGIEVTSIRTGDGVMQHWIEGPVVEGSVIHFAGIFPGGFTGVATAGAGLSGRGILFSFETTPAAPSVSLVDAAVYMHDGDGTKVAQMNQSQLLSEESVVLQEPDRTPPEWIDARRVHDSRIHPDGPVLVLDALDKESGISHFQVSEWNQDWVETQGPYVLRDTHGFWFVTVRAYDHAGNYREASIPPGFLPLGGLVAGIALLLALVLFVINRKRP